MIIGNEQFRRYKETERIKTRSSPPDFDYTVRSFVRHGVIYYGVRPAPQEQVLILFARTARVVIT